MFAIARSEMTQLVRNRLVAANEWTINAFSRTRHNLAVTEGQLDGPQTKDEK